jgi:alkylation response protein AidB-like acyl-CoA dehydrogenase
VTGTAGPAMLPGLENVLAGVAARAAEHDRDASFPHEAFEGLHATGALALTVPVAVGGRGAGLGPACRLIEAVGAADPSVALVLSQHLLFHAVLGRADNRWPVDVRDRVQRSTIDAVALINALRVEPELGTPARGGLPATLAERLPDDRGWRLTGRKTYSTGIPRLRWLAVWARTDDPEPLVGTFLVDADAASYRIDRTWDHLGMRATRSDDVVFEGTELPHEHAVAVAPAGIPTAEARDPWFLAWNNLVISSIYNGVARSARDWLVGYLNERTPTNLGAPLATLPRFQAAVGEIEALLHSNERLIHGTAHEVDEGPDRPGAAAGSSLVKRSTTANAIRAVEIGIALIGNPGLSRHHPIERHYRDVLCSRIHTPQDDTIALAAGKAALTRK